MSEMIFFANAIWSPCLQAAPFSPLLDVNLVESDELLSDILDGLIEFQEKSPVGRVADPPVGASFQVSIE
jgi:hypothetical protein